MNSLQFTLDQQIIQLEKAFRTMDAEGRRFILAMAKHQAERHPAHRKPLLTLVHSFPTDPVTAKFSK